jgi:hypothetical protein
LRASDFRHAAARRMRRSGIPHARIARKDKGEHFVTVVTGALAVRNAGIALVVGMSALALAERGRLRL